jgi:transcriptional regulator with XRE-family HTH domain
MTASFPEERRHRLGSFLRAKRQRRTAERDAGRAASSVRRVPGLRREEIAALAGISLTWYTRLEQGKAVSASADTLARIADVLKLDIAERKYLFGLAARIDPSPSRTTPQIATPQSLLTTVQSIATPAYLLDGAWTLCAWNAATAKVFTNLVDGYDKNLLLHMFLNPYSRHFLVDWEDRARTLVGQFRRYYEADVADARKAALVDRLCTESEDFRFIWSTQNVQARRPRRVAYDHPVEGRLVYDQVTLALLPECEFRLVILTPSGEPLPGA